MSSERTTNIGHICSINLTCHRRKKLKHLQDVDYTSNGGTHKRTTIENDNKDLGFISHESVLHKCLNMRLRYYVLYKSASS